MKMSIFFGLVLFGLLFLSCSYLVSAYTETPQEAMDDWYGNKFHRSATPGVSQTLTSALTVFGVRQRCQDDIEVNNLLFWFNARTGVWTSKNIRFGIMGINATGVADMTWKGATNNGYGWVNPVAGWNNVTLNEPVSLTAGTMYFYGVFDNGSKLSTTVTLTICRWGSPQDWVMGKPPLGRLEEYDGGVWRLGGVIWINYESGSPYLLWNRTNNVYAGQPYTSMDVPQVYMSSCKGQNFTWNDDNATVDKLGVMMRRSATAYIPNASVYYEVRSSMYGGSVLAGGLLAYPLDSGTSTGGRWNYAVLNKTVSMVNGSTYFLKFWSKAGASYYWRLLCPMTIKSGVYKNYSFQGDDSYTVTSADNGSTWSNFDSNVHCDIQFMFHKIQPSGLVVSDLSSDVTGSLTYYWSPFTGMRGEWWVNDTHKGIHESSDWVNLINCNPGNSTHGTNYVKKAVDLTTSLDIRMKNFTVLNETNLGSGIQGEHSDVVLYLGGGISIWNERTIGQVFIVGKNGTTSTNVIKSITVNISKWGNPGKLYIYIKEINDLYQPIGGILGYGFNETPITAIIPNNELRKINITQNCALYNNHKYMFYFDVSNTDVANFFNFKNSFFNDPYIWGNISENYPPSDIWSYQSQDIYFNISCWSLGGNISWSQCLNTSWVTNETLDGHWYEYANSTVVSNGTVTVPFLNASGVDTYYWRMNYSNPNITGSTDVFSFTTVNTTSGIIPIENHNVSSYFSIGLICSIPVGFFLMRRQRKRGRES